MTMAAATSPHHERVVAQLIKAMGADRAKVVLEEVLSSLGLPEVRSAHEQLRFANVLISRGGFLAVLGSSLKTQALLRGARE